MVEINNSAQKANSKVSKVYKHASELFLTRRLQEAFSALQPLVTVPSSSEENARNEDVLQRAPIANSSRRDRTRIWVLYLTMLNAISTLGPVDSKAAFGDNTWVDLITKAQDGTIWNEVVDTGYGGVEADVDADVVISLTTLLLAVSPTQNATQQHLETYLSAADNSSMNYIRRPNSSHSSNDHVNGGMGNSNGTDTPRDLNALVNIIELYTLHVLPRNGEWEYSRDFINMSEVLDEDSKDCFLQDLQSLKDEESRVDEDLTEAPSPTQFQEPLPPPLPRPSNTKTDPPRSRPVQPPRNPTSSSTYKSSIIMVSALQKMASQIGLLRFVLFLLLVAFSRRKFKNRLTSMTGAGWDKLRRTIGMGVKVSYI